MNDKMLNDRIRLAEAMGRPADFHDGTTAPNVFKHFDPFTSANDDYAVLEWANSKDTVFAVEFSIAHKMRWADYRIGDYARAALKVIECGE